MGALGQTGDDCRQSAAGPPPLSIFGNPAGRDERNRSRHAHPIEGLLPAPQRRA
jgi:hypothetical protein